MGAESAAAYVYAELELGMQMAVFLWSFLFISRFLFTSCYILRSFSPVPTHVFINNNYKSIRNYFEDERAKHLQMKSGHVAYFSSDGGERWATLLLV